MQAIRHTASERFFIRGGDWDEQRRHTIASTVEYNEEKLLSHIMASISSGGDTTVANESERTLLGFRGLKALLYVEFMQNLLDSSSSDTWEKYSLNIRHRRSIRRLLLKLSQSANVLPSSLFLKRIKCETKYAVACGGFSDIYCAIYDNKPVALKCLRAPSTRYGDEERKQEKQDMTFLRETLVWRQLNHRNILPFLGVDKSTFRRHPCMVLPWMENGNILQCIRQRQQRSKPIPLIQWVEQIISGLAYLHSEEIVHGDLRGNNIMINASNEVQLSDFGLARFADTSVGSSSLGGGAYRWLAPEVLNGSQRQFEGDIYAFGCVCLEVHTLQPPFADISHEAQVIAEVLRGKRPQPPTNPVVPSDWMKTMFWTVIETCWEPLPVNRPTAQQLLTILTTSVCTNFAYAAPIQW